MNFTEEQQAHIDSIIKKKYAEAHAKAEAKAAETTAAADVKHAEELNTLKAELEKLKASRGESNERMRRALLKAEVAQTSAVNTEQVIKLVSDNIKFGDDGNLTVVDESGVDRLDDTGKPYSVKEFVSEFLDANPHLKQASRSMGAGSVSPSFYNAGAAKTMRRAEFDKMGRAQQADYIRFGGSLAD